MIFDEIAAYVSIGSDVPFHLAEGLLAEVTQLKSALTAQGDETRNVRDERAALRAEVTALKAERDGLHDDLARMGGENFDEAVTQRTEINRLRAALEHTLSHAEKFGVNMRFHVAVMAALGEVKP